MWGTVPGYPGLTRSFNIIVADTLAAWVARLSVSMILTTGMKLDRSFSYMRQGLPFPTARLPGASKTTSLASGFEQIFLLYLICADQRISKFLESGKWWFWEKASPVRTYFNYLCHVRVEECRDHFVDRYIVTLSPIDPDLHRLMDGITYPCLNLSEIIIKRGSWWWTKWFIAFRHNYDERLWYSDQRQRNTARIRRIQFRWVGGEWQYGVSPWQPLLGSVYHIEAKTKWPPFIKNVVAVAAYSRLASRSQAKFHTKKLSLLVRPCAAAPGKSTTSAHRSLRFSPR